MRTSHIVGWSALALVLLGFSIWGLIDNTRLFLLTVLNGLTLASLYFIVASGFTLVFGLMRNVNLAHGSLYLLGGYVGFIVAEKTGWWFLALAAGFLSAGIVGLSEASSTAHRMEDLLDKMVELRVEASTDILEFLDASAMHLPRTPTQSPLN